MGCRECLLDLVQELCKGFAEDFPAGGVSPRVPLKIFCKIFAREPSRKNIEKSSKIHPGGSPEASRTTPGVSQNGPRTAPGTLTAQARAYEAKKCCASLTNRRLLGSFWDPAGTQKSRKNGPGAKKSPPAAAFLRFLWPSRVFLSFRPIFDRFLKVRTLTKVYIYIYIYMFS